MRNHLWRLITGVALSIVGFSVIRHSLGTCPADVWRRNAFFTFLALWAIATGAVLGALIYYDLRYSLRELGLQGSESDGNV